MTTLRDIFNAFAPEYLEHSPHLPTAHRHLRLPQRHHSSEQRVGRPLISVDQDEPPRVLGLRGASMRICPRTAASLSPWNSFAPASASQGTTPDA